MRAHPVSRLRASAASLGALMALTFAPLSANAAPSRVKLQGEAAVDEAEKARYAEGFRLYTRKQYEEARVAFLQAAALKRRPAATLMLALSSLKLGRWLEALRELDAYVAEVGDVPPKLRDIVESSQREARSHLGRLRFAVPEGSDVTVDGERVRSEGEPIDVVAGPHTVVIVHRGEKKVETIQAAPGRTVDVSPSFVPQALVPTSDTRTRPRPPPAPSEPQASTNILSPPATTWPVYVAGAIGLGGLATAAIFGGLSANSSHAVEVATETLVRNGQSRATCAQPVIAPPFDGTCRTLRDNERLAREHERTFGPALIVGASASVFAIGWFLLAPKERPDAPQSSGTLVVPWVAADGGGAAVRTQF
jgi:hypothetical protein